uniref:Putative Holliday junction ATPdependent DNA helicase ruvA n=1 Tax=termite gut metagenome TaxID=433724 RepID=S0DDW0_9ZZZZ
MIYSLTGIIDEAAPGLAVIRCAGVGYLVHMPQSAVGALPAPGGEATVYTCLNVAENDVSLYGFPTRAEREMFLMLTGVSGVGPKAALSILSVLTPDRVALAVSAGDFKAFTAASGVGPKLGQRLVLELRDKVAKSFASGGITAADLAAAPAPGGQSAPSQAVAALVGLGYTQSEAASAVAQIDPGLPAAEIIRLSLRSMGA